jgi:cytochrome c-type biogenesis protein CcmE
MKLSLKSQQMKTIGKLIWTISCLSIGFFCFFKVYRESFHLYQSPSQALSLRSSQSLRIGGVLKNGTLRYEESAIFFELTDEKNARLPVIFHGSPPRLLKEDQETIVFGYFENNHFIATEVLAKHDEYYRPKSQG